MPKDYALLFDDSVYAEMAKDDYRSPRWMGMPSVLTKATQNPRSKKKMEELCKKNAIKQGDTWTMRKTGKNRTVVTFSATVGSKSSVPPPGANTGCLHLTD